MLEPDYHKLRLLEIKIGRRYWQSNPFAETARGFHVRVVNPLRQLQRRGVVERLQEITGPDDRTPIAVEIIGQVDLTKLSKQWGRNRRLRHFDFVEGRIQRGQAPLSRK